MGSTTWVSPGAVGVWGVGRGGVMDSAGVGEAVVAPDGSRVEVTKRLGVTAWPAPGAVIVTRPGVGVGLSTWVMDLTSSLTPQMPAAIKRPVLDTGRERVVGFSEPRYQLLFSRPFLNLAPDCSIGVTGHKFRRALKLQSPWNGDSSSETLKEKEQVEIE